MRCHIFCNLLSLALGATIAFGTGCARRGMTSDPMQISEQGDSIVLSYNSPARAAAKQILERGGNAFDAYVAATFVEYVIAPGVTSMAGPLSTLIYEQSSGRVRYLDGDFNAVRDPQGAWSPDDSSAGKAVLIPGAVKALEMIANDCGNLPFSDLLLPAIQLAKEGFRIDATYAAIVTYRQSVLLVSSYGRETYFDSNSQPLSVGALQRQPSVARFLEQLAQNGSEYMYRGDWAVRAVQTIDAAGGRATAADFDTYRSTWVEPRLSDYRGYSIYGAPGRSIGGLHSMLGLKVLELAPFSTAKHFSTDPNGLELLVRISRYMYGTISNFTLEQLDYPGEIDRWFTAPYVQEMWRQISTQHEVAQGSTLRGSHSFHIIVADKWGNVVTGTNTINSLPWGDGLFVDGIALNAGGKVALKSRAGERTTSDRAMHIVFKDNQFVMATGAFNSSLMPANFQFLINALDYKLEPLEAVSKPRFGGFPLDFDTLAVDASKNYLDPRIPRPVIDELNRRGLQFQIAGHIDTGDGGIAIRMPNGSYSGAYSPSYLER